MPQMLAPNEINHNKERAANIGIFYEIYERNFPHYTTRYKNACVPLQLCVDGIKQVEAVWEHKTGIWS